MRRRRFLTAVAAIVSAAFLPRLPTPAPIEGSFTELDLRPGNWVFMEFPTTIRADGTRSKGWHGFKRVVSISKNVLEIKDA